MKLNARIRAIFKERGYWMNLEAAEKQGCKIDDISIYQTSRSRDKVCASNVSFRAYDPKREGQPFSQNYWGSSFSIRDSLGNPTEIGRMMGIKTRDKQISTFSSRGQAIEHFLYRMAWLSACDLTRDREQIKGRPYSDSSYKSRKVT